MKLEVLRRGSRGPLVEVVQTFLRGTGLYEGEVDGAFGPKTDEAVQIWQTAQSLKADGVIGNATWGSLISHGLAVIPYGDPEDDTAGPNWPPLPIGMRSLNAAQRAVVFGEIQVLPDPIKGSPENCKIIYRAPEYRIVEVEVPQLIGISGAPKNGKVLFHSKGARMLQLLFAAWETEGLIDRVLSWGGSLAVRYVRGSRTTLSPHAWGTAFDINISWNQLGAQPALAGARGSVRELVQIANEQGWYWGGHFTRPDGMHFEVVEIR